MVVFREKGHDEIDHQVVFGGFGFGNHQGERNKGVVGNALSAGFRQQQLGLIEKIEKKCGTNALVAIDESMVFDDEIEKIRGLFFGAGIDVFAIERLVDGSKSD